MPRSRRSVISTLGSNTRITIFSPKAVARLDTRSSTSRSARHVLMRPSCGRRRSAMSMRASTLMREVTAPCTLSGTRSISCRMPSMRKRITTVLVARLEVDVRGALVEGVVEQVVHCGDHVLVVLAGELLVAAQLHEGRERAGRAAVGEPLRGARHARAEAVDAVDDREHVALARDHDLERTPDQRLERLAQRARRRGR